MPRIRSVKPEFWTSERLATRLPGPDGRQARLLFIALWNLCEDHGVCRGSPALLRGAAFPYDDDVTTVDVERWVDMLHVGGFVERYEVGGSHYLHVRGFVEHQVINRPSKPTLPLPPENEPSRSPHGALTEPSRQERKGKEGSGKEDLPAPEGREASPQQPVLFGQPAQRQPADTPKKARQKPASEPKGDPRHQPLVDALVEAAPGYTFLGGQDAKAVKRLLELADADPMTRGDKAPEEVLRRWRICRAWVGFPASRHLGDFATNWNAYAKPQAQGTRPGGRTDTTPSDFSGHLPGTDIDELDLGGPPP